MFICVHAYSIYMDDMHSINPVSYVTHLLIWQVTYKCGGRFINVVRDLQMWREIYMQKEKCFIQQIIGWCTKVCGDLSMYQDIYNCSETLTKVTNQYAVF